MLVRGLYVESRYMGVDLVDEYVGSKILGVD